MCYAFLKKIGCFDMAYLLVKEYNQIWREVK